MWPFIPCAVFLACLLPVMVPWTSVPSTTTWIQHVSVFLWSTVAGSLALWRWRVAVSGGSDSLSRSGGLKDHGPWMAWLACLSLAIATSGHLQDSHTRVALAVLAVGAVLMASVSGLPRSLIPRLVDATLSGITVSALLLAGVAIWQIHGPAPAGWVSWLPTLNPGDQRASAFLRQPNHLATWLMWGLLAMWTLWLRRPEPKTWAWHFCSVLICWGLLLTQSRTGLLGLALLWLGLGAYALAQRSSAGPLRQGLWLLPLWVALAWAGHTGTHALSAWQAQTGERSDSATLSQTPASAPITAPTSAPSATVIERMTGQEGLSTTRGLIYSQALHVWEEQAWNGVGFGHFNKAWMLTAHDSPRSGELFDHSHQLILQFLAEFGLLGTVPLLALGAWVMWVLMRRSPWAAALLAVVLLHSQLEYPLWYAHFLLLTLWMLALGWQEGRPEARVEDANPKSGQDKLAPPLLTAASALALVITLGSALEMNTVAEIYRARPGGAPLPERIRQGQATFFHAQYAHHAAVTHGSSTDPVRDMERASHMLLDGRLMAAWVDLLWRQGEMAKVDWLLQRMRETAMPEAQVWLDKQGLSWDELRALASSDPRPVQGWRDFEN